MSGSARSGAASLRSGELWKQLVSTTTFLLKISSCSHAQTTKRNFFGPSETKTLCVAADGFWEALEAKKEHIAQPLRQPVRAEEDIPRCGSRLQESNMAEVSWTKRSGILRSTLSKKATIL